MGREVAVGLITVTFAGFLSVLAFLIRYWIGALGRDLLSLGKAMHDFAEHMTRFDRRLTRIEAKFDMHEVVEHHQSPSHFRRGGDDDIR